MADAVKQETMIAYATDIVASFVANNTVAPNDLPHLIQQVYKTLVHIDHAGPTATNTHDRPAPAVSVKKSVMPDYIICLEDGKRLKMLKRHLMTAYNMTPDEYRTRWNLPADYPMVAPNYARTRSRLAKDIGLGKKGRGSRKKRA